MKLLLCLLAILWIGMWAVAPDISNYPGVESHSSIWFTSGCPEGFICDSDFNRLEDAVQSAMLANKPLLIEKRWNHATELIPVPVWFGVTGSLMAPEWHTVVITKKVMWGK